MFITDTAKLSAAFSQDIRKSLDEGWKKITSQKQFFPMKYPSAVTNPEFNHPQPFPNLNNLLYNNRSGQNATIVKPENDKKKGPIGPRKGSHNAARASTLQQSTQLHNLTIGPHSYGKRGSGRTTTQPFSSKSTEKNSKNMASSSYSKSRPMSAPMSRTPLLLSECKAALLQGLKRPSLSSTSLHAIPEQEDIIIIDERESVRSYDYINASSSNFLAETDLVSANPLLRNIKTNEADVYSYLRGRIDNSNSDEMGNNEELDRDLLERGVDVDLVARGRVLESITNSEPLEAQALARVAGRREEILNKELRILQEENDALKSENRILRKQVHAINGLPVCQSTVPPAPVHSDAVERMEKEELIRSRWNDKLMDTPTSFTLVGKPSLFQFEESTENRFNPNGPDTLKSDLNVNNILNSKMNTLELLVTNLTQSLEKTTLAWEGRFSIHESRHDRTFQRFEDLFTKVMTIKHSTKEDLENNGNASTDKLDDEEKSLKCVKSEFKLNKKVQFRGILKP